MVVSAGADAAHIKRFFVRLFDRLDLVVVCTITDALKFTEASERKSIVALSRIAVAATCRQIRERNTRTVGLRTTR